MPRQVLIVDNDPGVRGLLAELVRRQGLDVRTAVDGEAARAVLAGDPVAGGARDDGAGAEVGVLVCDLDMPRLTGGQLLEWLDARPRQPQTVVVSGFVDDAARVQLERRPWVRAVLRKPFDVVHFAGLVRELANDPEGAGPAVADPAPATSGPGRADGRADDRADGRQVGESGA